MKKSLTVIMFCALMIGALFLALPTRAAQEGGDDPYEPNEVVVRLNSMGDVQGVATDFGLNPTPLDQFGQRPIFRFAIADGTLPPAKAEAMMAAQDSRILAAEPNYTGEIPEGQQLSEWAVGGNSGDYMAQWAPDAMHLDAAHTVNRGAGIRIAVLDTGIDATHPALAGRVLPGFDFVDFDDDPSEVGVYEQDFGYGHGTHVAGLIALAAPDAQIIPIRILEPDGSGNLWVLIEGLEYAVAQNADIINLSFSFTRNSEVLSEVVEAAICDDDDDDDDDDLAAARGGDDDDCIAANQRGIVFVAAAGNRGIQIQEFPAAESTEVPGLLAVGASTITDTLATFSTRGNWVQLAAPGQSILSTVPNNQYGTWSGTSMSAPLASGVAALVRAQNPLMRPSQVVQHLVTTAAPLNDATVRLQLDAAAALGVSPFPPADEKIWLPVVQ